MILQDLRYALRTMAASPASPRSPSCRWRSASAPTPRSSACGTACCTPRCPASTNPEQLVMLSDPDAVGHVERPLGRSHRRSAVVAHLRRIRATARSRRRLLGADGIAEQPQYLAGPLRRRRVGRSARPAGIGRILPGAGRRAPRSAGCSRPPTDRRRGAARRHQLQLLAAALRRPPRRARARPSRCARLP